MRQLQKNCKPLDIIYSHLNDEIKLQSFEASIYQIIKTQSIQKFEYQLPSEYRLDVLLKSIGESLKKE